MGGGKTVRAIGADSGLAHIPVLTCSWLSEADALALTGQDADGHLQKPELHYEDFVAALAGAGLSAAAQPTWQDNPACLFDRGLRQCAYTGSTATDRPRIQVAHSSRNSDSFSRSSHMSQIETIYNAVLEGDAAGTKAGVNAALDAGIRSRKRSSRTA